MAHCSSVRFVSLMSRRWNINFMDISSVVHRVDEDDEYNGYFIPKGTLVSGNIW